MSASLGRVFLVNFGTNFTHKRKIQVYSKKTTRAMENRSLHLYYLSMIEKPLKKKLRFLSTTIFGPERCHDVTACDIYTFSFRNLLQIVHPRRQIGGSILAIPFAQMLHKICLSVKKVSPSWKKLQNILSFV